MDRLIWIAWRAFWVGLGASAVLIGQSVVSPKALPPADRAPVVTPPSSMPAANADKSTDPILTRKPVGPRGVLGRKS